MKNILKIVFVLIGALIGAGFASGQEIYVFFFSYGAKGIYGIFISMLIIGIVINGTFKVIKKYDIKNYKEFLSILIGKSSNSRINIIINFIINVFILITFFIMIAGFGAYFEQEYGINSIVGSTILATLSYIVFLTSIKGVVKINEILIPILIIFLIIIGILNFKNLNLVKIVNYLPEANNSKWLISAILYSSYNSILLIPVIITLEGYITKIKQIKIISLITTIIAIILSYIIFIILIRVDVDISKLEMPVVYVVSNMKNIFKIIYGFIILGSIFTTSTALGNSFLQNIETNKKSYPQFAAIMCITAVLVSKIGFSNLINLLYPIFGYIGIIQIIKIIYVNGKNNKFRNKY